ncbi:hypothetical protein GCM10022280_10000 [Sphingomonas swuensis]|uniref:TraB/GumN family protein n=1 Tax=Sphingomonas swuensis TaxID=977800 RepID=A0ABP7SM52_9SPHN
MSVVQSAALAALLLGQATPVPPPVVTVVAPPRIVVAPAPAPARSAAEVIACQRAFYGQDYLPQPPLFRIRDSDTTLYLLGSIHILPPGFDWRSKQLDEVIAVSDMLITESAGKRPDALNPFAPTPTTPSPHPPLRDRLRGERLAKWLGMAAMGPRPVVEMIDRMPSWLAAFTIGGIAGRTDVTLGRGVETQLEIDFRLKRKPLAGLEDGQAVFDKVGAMPAPVQQAMLDQALDQIGTTRTSADLLATFHRWARGEEAADPSESGLPPELRQILLDARNQAWVPEVEKHLQKPGSRLVVVGAAHLRGKGSLLDTLAARGITAERISPTGPPKPRALTAAKPATLRECSGRLVPPLPPSRVPRPSPPPPASAAPPPPSPTASSR